MLMGHAMGGAIATKMMNLIEREMEGSDLQKSIKGLIVLDITDGIARDALPFMEEVISNRPTSFPDASQAIRYAVMGKQIRDKRSACVSVPAQLVQVQEGDGAAAESGKNKLTWRTDLSATMPFWESWFKDFNASFLAVKENKWLFLANSDGIDDDLYGAMEGGKFEMHSIPNTGHFLHEDQPGEMAERIKEILTRRKIPVEWNTQMFIINAAGKKVFITK